MINKTTLTVLTLALVLVGGITLSKRNNPVKNITVSSPTVSTVSNSTSNNASDKADKKYKVERIEADPEQLLLLNTEVNSQSVELLISELEIRSRSNDELFMVISSPGGSVFDGARLIAYMEASTAKIHTICYDLCASMAAQIFSHGKTRYMVDGSVLMFHQAAGGFRGPLKNLKSLFTFVEREVMRLDAYVADRAGIPREEFDKLTTVDLWISAKDSVDLKLADSLSVITVSEEKETFNVSKELARRGFISNKTNTNPLKEIVQ